VVKCFLKLKFADFRTTTVECAGTVVEEGIYENLLVEGWRRRQGRNVRLIGAGVRFADVENGAEQLELL